MFTAPIRFARSFGRRWAVRGTRYALRWVWHRLYESLCERSLGVDTKPDGRWRQELPSVDCHGYLPLPYDSIQKAIERAAINPEHDVFLDYGSGKGRAVITAATYPFRRVIGIDVSESLNEIARANLRSARPKLHSRTVQVITADARDYRLPDDATVLYFYNPFRDEVMQAVQREIRRSLDAVPRNIKILYLYPQDQVNPFADCQWLRPVERVDDLWENVRLAVYENHQDQGAELAVV